MTPIDWAIRPLKHYADFDGRAPRAEYWWYTLAAFVVGMLFDFLDKLFGGPVVGVYGPLSIIFTLTLFVPGISVAIRRLHDIDRTGWWVLLDAWSYVFTATGFTQVSVEAAFKAAGTAITMAVVVGVIVCSLVGLVFAVTRGTEGPNRYGPDPYGRDALEEVFA